MNHEYQASQAQRASIARYTVLILALLNAVLNLLGVPTIPIEHSEAIAAGIVAVVGLYAGFKNNYLTRFGKTQANILAGRDQLKR